MTYKRISLEQAKTMESFFAPGITQLEDAKEYWYYIGFEEDEKKIIAAAAVDPVTSGSRLLSIGVSPERLRQKIGSELLEVIVKDLRNCYEAQNKTMFPPITFKACMSESEWEIPDAFFTYNEFGLMKTEILHSALFSDILKNEDLKKAVDHHHLHTGRIKALKDVSSQLINNFGHDIHEKGIYPGIYTHELDPELSVFYIEDEKIRGCFLMSRMEDGNLMNQWAYLDQLVEDRSIILHMFALSALNCGKQTKKDIQVYFLPVAERAEKLIAKMLPNANTDYQVRIYEKDLVTADKTPVFEMVTEDQMTCKGCIYSTGSALKCKKYAKKPGIVLYGGECGNFAKAED